MKAVFLILLFIALKGEAQQKIEWRGCYIGAQVLTPIVFRQRASPSAYVIALAGIKRWTFNVQYIVPIQNYNRNLIKFGLDFKLF